MQKGYLHKKEDYYLLKDLLLLFILKHFDYKCTLTRICLIIFIKK